MVQVLDNKFHQGCGSGSGVKIISIGWSRSQKFLYVGAEAGAWNLDSGSTALVRVVNHSPSSCGSFKICAWSRYFENKCIGVTPKRINAELLKL